MKTYQNPNPRLGVLLEHAGASVRLCNAMYRLGRTRGLNWLRRHWPEDRLRRELIGYGPGTSREWNGILERRGLQQRVLRKGEDY